MSRWHKVLGESVKEFDQEGSVSELNNRFLTEQEQNKTRTLATQVYTQAMCNAMDQVFQ